MSKKKFHTHPLATERTFTMIKPDGVMRGLIGEIIARVERRGLKIIGLKLVHASREHVDSFYPKDKEWISRLGQKGLGTFKEYNLDPKEHLGTTDPYEIGLKVREDLISFMCMGPVVPMVIEGLHARSVMRQLVGATLPVFADPGTIRGDFSHDAPTAANLERRSIFNLVHSSETAEEAAHEIAHWFAQDELWEYDRADHVIMFGDKR